MPEMLVDFFIERNSYYLPMILATLALCFYRARWFLVARFIDLHYLIEATEEMWYEIEQVFIHEPLDEYEILLFVYYSRRFARNIFRSTFLQATITKLIFYLKPISLKVPKIGYLGSYIEHNKKFRTWFSKNIE